MKKTEGVVCRQCRGLNQPGSRFCWFCGARLPGGWRELGSRRTTREWVFFGIRWFLTAAVVLAIIGGLYYAVERYLLPLFLDEEPTATTVIATSTSVTRPPTTTTTTIPRVNRVIRAGTDRYATSIALSELGFPDGAPALVLVAGDDYAEAVCAAPLAAAYEGPMLLLPPDGLRDDLIAEIQRLDPSRVFLVNVAKPKGTTAGLQEFLDDPEVISLAGANPYETAALVAKAIQAKSGTVSKVVIAPTGSFVEAIAVAPLAAAKGWPILLAPQEGELPRATRKAIEDLAADSALVVGAAVEPELDDVEHRVGADSFETVALILEYAKAEGMSYAHTAIATGDFFPDGLAAGPYLALDRGILLLATDGRLTPTIRSLFEDNLKDIRTLDIIALPDLADELVGLETVTGTTGSGG